MRPLLFVGFVVSLVSLQAQTASVPVPFTGPLSRRCLEEFSKSDERIRNNDFNASRTLPQYLFSLPQLYAILKASEIRLIHWVDLGAGLGVAGYDALNNPGLPPLNLDPNAHLTVTLVGAVIGERQYGRSFKEAKIPLYIEGYLDRVADQIQPADVITDVVGPFHYTRDLSETLRISLSLLKVGGVYMTDTEYLSHTIVSGGIHSWLSRIQGITIESDPKGWGRVMITGENTPIVLKRTSEDLVVPPLKLVSFEESGPPYRRFTLESDSP